VIAYGGFSLFAAEHHLHKKINRFYRRFVLRTTIQILLCILAGGLLSACGPYVYSPDYGSVVPESVTSVKQIRYAIALALAQNEWQILEETPSYFQAKKQDKQSYAVIYVVYGYEAYDIEYAFGQNMQYNPEQNSISRLYMQWERDLVASIDQCLLECHYYA